MGEVSENISHLTKKKWEHSGENKNNGEKSTWQERKTENNGENPTWPERKYEQWRKTLLAREKCHSGENVPHLEENWATILKKICDIVKLFGRIGQRQMGGQLFLVKIHAESAAGCKKFLWEVYNEMEEWK